jgi:predicted aldo/keto reductase-like oxidoreductase
MKYRAFGKNGDRVSILGYGCMRYPKKNGRVDLERTAKQIRMAIEAGVNYFDTAYVYPGSEEILGEILSDGLREKVRIATKIPPYLVSGRAGMEKIFKTQLERLKTDYIDCYLLHALTEFEGWEKAKAKGIVEFLEDMKSKGVVRHIGFSYHGDADNFKRIIDDYAWDFCQIQYNYIDEHNQAGREGLKYAYSKGISVVVMEPLRGGRLVGRMPEQIQSIWDRAPIQRSYADWAFRWIWDQPEASVVLSGLNEESHIEENLRIADEVKANALTAEELQLYREVADKYRSLMKVGCTGCGYCLPCPAGVNIPFCFSYYNSHFLFKGNLRSKMSYIVFSSGMQGGESSQASRCIQCGKCEKVCPQHLPIRRHLGEVRSVMEPLWARSLFWLIRKALSLVGGKRKKP